MAAFEKAQERFREEGITVVAGSVDPLEKARETVTEFGLTFPVGYGLPVRDVARTFGAFYEEKRQILHATGFVVKPDRTIAVAQYSTGPIGRLVWQDVLGLIQFYKQQAAQAPKS